MPASAAPARRHYLLASALWFGFYAQWMVVVPIILPGQVQAMLGPDDAGKELATGLITGAGAIVSLLITPLAGRLSDRARSPRGRRWPFLASGVLASCLLLALLSRFGAGDSLLAYAALFLALQCAWNWAAGPLAGLIPDSFAPQHHATASSWMNALNLAGIMAGGIAMALLGGNLALVIAILIAWMLAGLVATRFAPAQRAGLPQAQPRQGLRGFFVSPAAHPNFYRVLVARFAANMGIWSITEFLLFYVQAVLQLPLQEAGGMVGALLATSAIAAIPSGFLGARLAGRFGLVPVVQAASWLMALATLGYVALTLQPDSRLVFALVVIFGLANGAFAAVDWWLTLKVLPDPADAGKDLGIWHACMVLPQILAPVVMGATISGIRLLGLPSAAYQVAFALAALWFAVSALLVGRVQLRQDAPA